MKGQANLDRRFTYHAPTASQLPKYAELRTAYKDLAYLVDQLCPDSYELSMALQYLETASFWSNAAIARGE